MLQIKALRNTIERTRAAYEASGDSEKEVHYVSVVGTASGIREQREAAQICAGELDLRSDSIGGYVGPDIPDDPGAVIFPPDIEPPGYASPFN